jgi:PilZ domain
MFAAHAVPEPAVRLRPDRRSCARFVHSGPVQINGQPGVGRDISDKGICVISTAAVGIGDIVRVSIPPDLSAAATPDRARVTRVESCTGRPVIGLEFVN